MEKLINILYKQLCMQDKSRDGRLLPNSIIEKSKLTNIIVVIIIIILRLDVVIANHWYLINYLLDPNPNSIEVNSNPFNTLIC